jgi:hypothetical protein
LIDAFARGAEAMPRWTYAAGGGDAVRGPLAAARAELVRAPPCALTDAYAARIEELALEADLMDAAGGPRFGELAARRFPGGDAAADRLAEAWLAEEPDAFEDERVSSDGREEGSLVSRMRAEIGRLRLPFTVSVQEGLASLAATGDRVVFVAAGRTIGAMDVTRTVLHEVYGHVLPRARAAGARSGLFAAGTARGVDEQEGYALLLEDRSELLAGARRKQLGARHAAARAMSAGATFVDTVRTLINVHELETPAAVLVAERAFRGGDGLSPGLGRDRVYLSALGRVRGHLAAHPEDEIVLASGQIAVAYVDAVRGYS